MLLDEMYNQFMAAIPKTLAPDISKRDVVKNIKDLYAAKGTSEGHKLFLRMMFAEEADIFYPTKYMLRVSDGNWSQRKVIRCENQPGADGSDIIGQYITGQTSGATVFVTNAIGFAQGANSITEFDVDDTTLVGTFVEGETIAADSINEKVEMKFTIQKIVSGTTINDAGILYTTGDPIDIDDTSGNGRATLQVDTTSLGKVKETITDIPGINYRVGDTITYATWELNTVDAAGFVSIIGGSILSEDSDNSDGYNDYIEVYESKGYFQSDSIYFNLYYMNRYDPFYGFVKGYLISS